ncbi:AAA-domain-containing protein [Favolaschia claudopus]|uniref:vesicle-fusing ATPase n=1 Tax=Favolaschia claudopus TaxID=2862362 RepID=A0AAW0AGA9_9AGAR
MVPRQASLDVTAFRGFACSANSHLEQKAIEIAQKAIENDKAQNHREACKEYMDALDYFMVALKYEKNEQFKILIRSKIDNYLSRAEILKKHLAGPVAALQSTSALMADEDPETKKLRAGLSEAILGPAGSDVSWDDIAGLEAAKMSLKEAVILPLKFPHLFSGMRKPWRGILLYGPPGTGKSYLAKAVATEAKSTLVKHLFQMAREMKPAIIFIDEIDSMTGARGDGDSDASRRLKTEFLVQMDGVAHDNKNVLVIGATNIPWQIDLSIKRRYSGADIQIVVQDALMQPIRKLITATHFKPAMTGGAMSSDEPVKWVFCSPEDPKLSRSRGQR